MLSADRLTVKAAEALQAAAAAARRRGNAEIHGVHLLAALLSQEEGIVTPVLQKLEVNRFLSAFVLACGEDDRVTFLSDGECRGGTADVHRRRRSDVNVVPPASAAHESRGQFPIPGRAVC